MRVEEKNHSIKEVTSTVPAACLAPSRNESLDALRGLAILAMVLSGSIAFGGVLPAWMYHAQVPPPAHRFNPELPGISWVDLVFPFFLFSMGAAIPLSLRKLEGSGGGWKEVLIIALRRFLLLVFFALFSFHMRAWVIAERPGTNEQLLSILGFVLLFFQLYEYRGAKHQLLFKSFRIAAFLTAVVLLALLSFGGKGFQKERSDIILLVLANMAFFGTITWWATRRQPLIRLGLLPFLMAILLSGKDGKGWQGWVYIWPDQHWLYWFYYLKYLFLIIPGSFAGEWLARSFQEVKEENDASPLKDWTSAQVEGDQTQRGMHPQAIGKEQPVWLTVLVIGLIAINVIFLFGRHLLVNLVATSTILLIIRSGARSLLRTDQLLKRCYEAGAYLLLLGLAFESFEGGVKKDPSTFSYYFITSGLAFFMLIGLAGLRGVGGKIRHYLALNGRNPMVAYVAGNLLLLPLMKLTGLAPYFDAMNGNAWIGFLRGVLFTGIVSLITVFFVKRGWFWKT